MLELCEWIRTMRPDDRPWLVLGKGPTFGRRSEFDLSQYRLLALNHVVRELPVEVAHIIDIDVVEDCADRLLENCQWLLMPRVPHIQQRPGHALLEDYRDAIPVLRELDAQGRLVWYNARTGPRMGDSPVIDVRNVLGELGAPVVRSLGIDGGSGYSAAFSSFSGGGRSGPPPYDRQFDQIQRIVDRYKIDYAPLIEPLRIYIGASRGDLLGLRVLDHSIRKHASVPVRVIPMVDLPVPPARNPLNRPRTGFSFSRFLVPELAGHRGRAVYLDSDMVVFGDVAELATVPFGDHKVLCTYQEAPPAAWADNPAFHTGRHSAVMVLDCDRLKWDIQQIVDELDEGRVSYEDLMSNLCLDDDEIGLLPQEWNHLERFDPGETKLLHYTVGELQPWKIGGNPLEHLWLTAFREAIEAGAVPPHEVRRLVSEGYVRPEFSEMLPVTDGRIGRDTTAADVALTAAFDRIDELESAKLRVWVPLALPVWRRQARVRLRQVLRAWLRQASRPLSPLVRKARALDPSSPVGSAVERLADRVRTFLN
jgi:hypothetical protein